MKRSEDPTLADHTTQTSETSIFGKLVDLRFLKALLVRQPLRLLDLALLVSATLLIFTPAKIFYFHLIFILLVFGAFYWELSAFSLRASFWVAVTSVIIFIAVLTDQTHADELIELPLLTVMLILVFVIARQRSVAEDEVRQTNVTLERRVQNRTAELTVVNARLLSEVNQHKSTEATLRESEERYRRLLELSFEAIIILREGEVLTLNSAGVALFGATTPGDLVGRSIFDFIHPDFESLTQRNLTRIIEQGQDVSPFEGKLRRLDGTEVEIEMGAISTTYLGKPAVQMIVRDISSRRQAEMAREQERIRVARNLHDSLGQNLGYMRLKLDEFTNQETFPERTYMQAELVRMRDVANEAYETVRGMLAASLAVNAADLATALLIRAKMAAQQGDFELNFHQTGQPRPVSAVIRQQLIYICQESLTNIVKHAQARQVALTVAWESNQLQIHISDDGLGFDLVVIQPDGHFGLTIMQERAAEIGVDLLIRSAPDQGTDVIVCLPFASDVAADRPLL